MHHGMRIADRLWKHGLVVVSKDEGVIDDDDDDIIYPGLSPVEGICRIRQLRLFLHDYCSFPITSRRIWCLVKACDGPVALELLAALVRARDFGTSEMPPQNQVRH